MTEQDRRVVILLVEDNPGDVRLTKEALQDIATPSVLVAVEDGSEAMAFLRRQDNYAEAPRPDLVLLDLNLPRKDGRRVLAEMKGDAQLRRIPVVVLSTSASDDDIRAAYDLHANCYITKPLDLERFLAVIQSIDTFWLKTVRMSPD